MASSLTTAVRAAAAAARRVGASHSRPKNPKRPNPAKAKWESTPEQIDAQIRAYSGSVRDYVGGGSYYRLVRVPIARVEADFDYGAAKYRGTRDGDDVEKLAELMRNGTPLPPASGYADATWYGPTDGLYGLLDGNHRISAARLVGLKTVPMVIPVRARKNPKRPSPPLTDEYVHTVLSEAVVSSRGMKPAGRATIGNYTLRIFSKTWDTRPTGRAFLWLLLLGKNLVGTGRLVTYDGDTAARAGIAVIAKDYRRQGALAEFLKHRKVVTF